MKYESLEPDNYYHIYNCGNNKENIFIEERNYVYFLGLLHKHIIPVTEIYAYCLLKNHFHLLIRTKEDFTSKYISQQFSNLFNAYSKAINKNYGRSGSLFKTRFSRKKISSEEYLKQLILYIHLNPQYHGFTTDFKTYKHSSYHAMFSSKKTSLARIAAITLFSDIENFKFVHESKKTIVTEKLETYLLE